MGYPTPRDPVRQGRDTRERIDLLERRLANGFSLPGRLTPEGAEVADWDLALENGWYWSRSGALNNPVGNIAVGHVISYGPDGTNYNRIMQEVWFPTVSAAQQWRTWRRVGSGNQAGTAWTWTAWTLFDATSHKHDAADITSGVFVDDRLPERLRGTASLLVKLDLDAIIESGWYVQTTSSNISAALHYPESTAGFLEVVRAGAATGSGVGVLQRYTTYHPTQAKREWIRTWYGSWGPWQELTAPDWGKLTGVPSTFPPSAHTHTWSQITDPLVTVTPTNKLAADGPGTYPQGLSYHSVDSAASGWPANIGTVVTVRHSAFRQYQEFFDRGSAVRRWFRTANGETAWQAWREVMTDASTPSGPFAVATGIVSSTNPPGLGNPTVIALPAGKFTLPPVVLIGNGTQSTLAIASLVGVTTTDIQVRMKRADTGAEVQATNVHWTATQMTATSATG